MEDDTTRTQHGATRRRRGRGSAKTNRNTDTHRNANANEGGLEYAPNTQARSTSLVPSHPLPFPHYSRCDGDDGMRMRTQIIGIVAQAGIESTNCVDEGEYAHCRLRAEGLTLFLRPTLAFREDVDDGEEKASRGWTG